MGGQVNLSVEELLCHEEIQVDKIHGRNHILRRGRGKMKRMKNKRLM